MVGAATRTSEDRQSRLREHASGAVALCRHFLVIDSVCFEVS